MFLDLAANNCIMVEKKGILKILVTLDARITEG